MSTATIISYFPDSSIIDSLFDVTIDFFFDFNFAILFVELLSVLFMPFALWTFGFAQETNFVLFVDRACLSSWWFSRRHYIMRTNKNLNFQVIFKRICSNCSLFQSQFHKKTYISMDSPLPHGFHFKPKAWFPWHIIIWRHIKNKIEFFSEYFIDQTVVRYKIHNGFKRIPLPLVKDSNSSIRWSFGSLIVSQSH